MSQQKTFASAVSFQLGLLTVLADVVPVRRTGSAKAASFVNICPECVEPTRPKQQYVCEHGHGPYGPTDLVKARDTEDGLRRFSAEEVSAVRESEVPAGVMTLNVCPAAELEAATRPSEQSYRLRLGKKSQPGAYVLLRALASNPDVGLYGVCKLNGRVAPTPYRLTVWRDQLVIQSLIRPADVAEGEEIEGDVDEALLDMGNDLIKKLSKPFDPELLTDERVAKLAEIVQTQTGEVTPLPIKSKPASDLMAQLAAALEVA